MPYSILKAPTCCPQSLGLYPKFVMDGAGLVVLTRTASYYIEYILLLRKAFVASKIRKYRSNRKEKKAARCRTTKICLNNFIKFAFTVMRFIRADGEADWALKLYAVGEITAYFFL